MDLDIDVFENMLLSALVFETHIFEFDVPLDARVYHFGVLTNLNLLFVLGIENEEDMGSSNFSLVHIRHEMRIIADGDTSEKDLIDCSKNIQNGNSIVAHEDSSNVEEHTESNEGHNLGYSEEKSRDNTISSQSCLRTIYISGKFIEHCILNTERHHCSNVSQSLHNDLAGVFQSRILALT